MRTPLLRQWTVGAAASLGLALALVASQQVVARPAQLTDARFDLTGNEVVNGADLAEAAEQWAEAAGGGAGLAAADLNGDGALDVADVQQVAAQVGQGTTPAALAALNGGGGLAQAVPEKLFVVNSAASGNPNSPSIGDVSRGDGVCATAEGLCTLQAAVQESNAPRISPYRARITFDIRDESGGCPGIVRIVPDLDYERWLQIDDSSGHGTIIDGYTQCGAQPNSEALDGNAVIRIELVGTKFGQSGAEFPARDGVNGIEIKSSNNLIRGLALYNWDRQIELSAPGALYNQIQGNFIGTDATGTFISKPRNTHHGEGIRLQYGASYNVIGCGAFSGGTFQPCTDPAQAYAARNIVVGNGNDGIHIERNDSHHNHIVGNYIGVAEDGKNRLASDGTSISKNQADGVDFEAGANNNWLGGESTLERNIIAANTSDGIEISHNSLTQHNRVVGNYFGLDAYGDVAPNGNNGISVEDTANNNLIYRNFVGGNQQSGIRAYVLADDNHIYENTVGVGPDGSPRPNRRHGVYIMGGSQNNLIENNVIAHNGDRGVVISTESDVDHGYFGETHFNTISRNSIYNNFREGIKLTNREDPQPLGNQNLPKPVIEAASATLVVGTACPGCRIEVFIADKLQLPEPGGENSGEGRTFVGAGVATASGQFAVTINGVTVGQLVTATATDTSGNTSEFARNFIVGAGPVATLTPAPTLTPTTPPSPTALPTTVPGQAPGPHRAYLPLARR